MREVISILAGVFLSGVTSLCFGLVLFRRLAVQLDQIENLSLAFVTGSACFSQTIFVFSSIHLARRSVFIAIALIAVAATIGAGRTIPAPVRLTPLARRWKWFAAALFASFAVVYLVTALAPEMSPDGSAYHLPFVDRYLRAHGFERITGDFYASLSQGIELLFMPAVSLGGHSSAALLHFLFLLDLPLMMICCGRRFGFPIPAAAAAFLVFASPLIGWDGTSAYVDVAAAAILFALYYLLQIWDAERDPNLLILIGILAGFSYTAKYSAAIAVPYALGFVSWRLWRGRKPLLRPLLTIAGLAAIFILPWMLKNVVQIGNPLAPFGNHLFPNPYLHVSFERGYRSYLRHYHLTNWLSTPLELTVSGERLQGFFGPVFLLTPLALLSLRRRAGRRLLLAGTAFALPWFLNIGSRFLIPALPPLAMALALAVEHPAWLLPSIVVLHAVLSWYAPPVRYFDRYAPRIAALPVRAALRIEPDEAYLARWNAGYLIDRMIERQVPPGNRVFSFEPIPRSWTTREIVAAQNAAENEVLADVLRTALVSRLCPMQALDFRFPPILLRRVRAVQAARIAGEMWSVSEFQLRAGGRPLATDGKWHITGNPNPWDVRLAFDANPVTRWRSWEDATPGMFLEVDFGRPKLLDQVSLITSADSLRNTVYLRGMDAVGRWRDLPASPLITPAQLTRNLRADAVRELLAHGIRYLLVTPAAFGANEFNQNAAVWGMRLTGQSAGARLYRLDPDQVEPEPAAPVLVSREAPVPPGAYDDTDPRMHLHEPWTHDPQFQEAYHHTLTYSDIPGASLSLVFNGGSVTYVYTRASNRGIAEVRVDGQLKGRLDLYAPDTSWKTRRTYEGLGPGGHTIEIRVTGQRNPHATGCFVDLDALIVE
jgi:hypothetical protein